MFGTIGTQELLLIFLVVLLLFGPKRLPELARGLARAMGEFKRAAEELREEIERADSDSDQRSQESKS